jgi:hypothetical protein
MSSDSPLDIHNFFVGLRPEVPSHPLPYRYLAACYAHMGRIDEARKIIARLRAITPVVMPAASEYRIPEHRELFLSGLRLAAGETT